MNYPQEFESFFFSQAGIERSQVSRQMLAQVYELESKGELTYIEFFEALNANENSQLKSHTKPAEEFRGPLKGVWKIHYYHPNFLLKNIGSDLGFTNGLPSAQFNKIFYSIFTKAGLSIKQKAARLAEELVIGPIKRRSQGNKLTGEWILFKKFQGRNYYLCLGFHEQTNEELLTQIENIIAEAFPFLLKPEE